MPGIRSALQAWARSTLASVETQLSKIPPGSRFHYGYGYSSPTTASARHQTDQSTPVVSTFVWGYGYPLEGTPCSAGSSDRLKGTGTFVTGAAVGAVAVYTWASKNSEESAPTGTTPPKYPGNTPSEK